MFKKALFVVLFTTAFMLAPLAHADERADLQAQIDAIMVQIKQLQAQLNATQGGSTSSAFTPTSSSSGGGGGGGLNATSFCYNWKKPLRVGDSGADVGYLQTALQELGFSIADSEQPQKDGQTIADSSFGESTASAVVEFQEKYASDILTPNGLSHGTGFVGASTRAKLNSLYGCGQTAKPLISESIKCVFAGSTSSQSCYSTNKAGKVYTFDGVETAGGLVSGYRGEQMTWKSSCGGYAYTTIDGNNDYANFQCAAAEPTATPTTSSQPSIHISASSGNQTSDSAISVNIGDAFTISGIPQNLQGLSYNFGANDSQSNGFSRAYFFDQNFANNNTCGNNDASASGQWSMFCTAKVSGSSFFYIEIYKGGQTYRSNTVYVKINSSSTQPSITVLSPNGGETWQTGTTQLVQWQPYTGDFDYYTLSLENTASGGVGISIGSLQLPKNSSQVSFALTDSIVNGVIANSGGKTASQIQGGYYVHVRVLKNTANGAVTMAEGKSNVFTITAATTVTKPSISSVEPSSGAVNSTVTVYGSGFNFSSQVLIGDNVTSAQPTYVSSDGTKLTFVFPASAQTIFPSNNYSLRVSNVGNVGVSSGLASNYMVFTITAPTSGPTTGISKSLVCGSLGDANGDGGISSADVDLIRSFVLGTITLTDAQKKNADVNGDGNVTTADISFINRYLQGLDPTLPACSATTQPSLSASLQNIFTDRAGSWNNFSPGPGNGNKNPADWNFTATLTLSGTKSIKSISLAHANGYEGWSTSYSNIYGKTPYPLVVDYNDRQIVYGYDTPFLVSSFGAGTHTFKLYAQIETAQFSGGTLTVTFTDGTSVSTTLSASPYTPPTTTTTQPISVKIVDGTTYGTSGDAFIRLSIAGYPSNKQIHHWVLGYTCSTGVTLDTGKSLLCDGQTVGKSGLTFYGYNIYDVTSDYLMITASAQNKNASPSQIIFTLDARDASDRSLGTSDTKTITLNGITTAQPFISSVAGKAAGNGEIDAGGAVGIQGTNLVGYKDSTNVYIGGMVCTITQISNTLIYCNAPSTLQVGSTYDLYINTAGMGGDKVTSNIVKVRVLSNVSQPSITVLSPNGGETFTLGSSIPVVWTTNYNSNSVRVHLYSPTVGDVYVSPMTSSTIGKNGWTIPINAADTPGQYKINVCDDNQSPAGLPGKSLCDLSDSYFTITAPTPVANQPPVINSATGPTSLTVGQLGQWNVSATDPEAAPLNFTAYWGDGGSSSIPNNSVGAGGFSHSWSAPGTYKVTFAVSDSASNVTKDLSVTVTAPTATTPTPTPATTPVSDSLSFSLVSTTEDKTGGYTFAPGNGADWSYNATLNLSAPKTIQSMQIAAGSEIWSTASGGWYSIVVFDGATQLNSSYGQTFSAPAGTKTFTLYAQKWFQNFNPAYKLTVTFTDGTSLSATVQPTTLSVNQSSQILQMASALESMKSALQGMLRSLGH